MKNQKRKNEKIMDQMIDMSRRALRGELKQKSIIKKTKAKGIEFADVKLVYSKDGINGLLSSRFYRKPNMKNWKFDVMDFDGRIK
jgi:hypothetical protein